MSVHDERLKEHRQAQWYVTLLGRCLAETSNPEEAAMAAQLAFEMQPTPPSDFKFEPEPAQVSVSAPAPAPAPSPVPEAEIEQQRWMLEGVENVIARMKGERETDPILRSAFAQAEEWRRGIIAQAEEWERAAALAVENPVALSANGNDRAANLEAMAARAFDAITAIINRPIIVNLPPRPKRIVIKHADGSESTIEPSGDASPRSIIFRQNADGTTAEESSAESN